MEINKFFAWVFVFWSFSSCQAQRNEFAFLIVKDIQINEILKQVLVEESKYGSTENKIIIMRVENDKNEYEIRIGILSEESISPYLTGKQDKPVGFFDFEGVTVVVFGEDGNMFFEKTINKKYIPFLEAKPEVKIKEGEVPPPPVIYEPIIWIYIYNNEKFILTDKGRFTLLI